MVVFGPYKRAYATASTGPRPRGRGWWQALGFEGHFDWLQRGRDHVVADGIPRPAFRRSSPGFNGAATTWSRMGAERSRDRRQRPASTGPRPRGRGWFPTPDAFRAMYELQRGRDHVVADGNATVIRDRPDTSTLQRGRDH